MKKVKYIQSVSRSRRVQTYKFRAECFQDVYNFLKRVPGQPQFRIERGGVFPDCEIEFRSNMTTGQLKEILNDIPNSHVMVETLALASEYTGIRD